MRIEEDWVKVGVSPIPLGIIPTKLHTNYNIKQGLKDLGFRSHDEHYIGTKFDEVCLCISRSLKCYGSHKLFVQVLIAQHLHANEKELRWRIVVSHGLGLVMVRVCNTWNMVSILYHAYPGIYHIWSFSVDPEHFRSHQNPNLSYMSPTH
jgi:hypothetical protein